MDDNDVRFLALVHSVKPDPAEPESIDPLGWLRNMIDDCRRRGPAEDDEDPDAYWLMVSEVQRLHDRVRTVLRVITRKL